MNRPTVLRQTGAAHKARQGCPRCHKQLVECHCPKVAGAGQPRPDPEHEALRQASMAEAAAQKGQQP